MTIASGQNQILTFDTEGTYGTADTGAGFSVVVSKNDSFQPPGNKSVSSESQSDDVAHASPLFLGSWTSKETGTSSLGANGAFNFLDSSGNEIPRNTNKIYLPDYVGITSILKVDNSDSDPITNKKFLVTGKYLEGNVRIVNVAYNSRLTFAE